jgi:hypothetical protein
MTEQTSEKQDPSKPNSTRDLLPSERRFLAAMQQLGFGRLEFLQIYDGELVLDPWPATVQDVKFGAPGRNFSGAANGEFALKQQVAELFEYIRSVDSGEIRALEIRHGLPFSMEIELAGAAAARQGGRNA